MQLNCLKRLGILFLSAVLGSGCGKFLDTKPDAQLFVPSQDAELQALLDYYPTMNRRQLYVGEVSADNYYLTEQDWEARTTDQRRIYIWEPDYIFPTYPNQWSDAYEGVFVANTVLAQDFASNEVRAQAYFFRSRLFAEVAFAWAPAYDPETADRDFGIPLRLTDDFNEQSVRSSVAQTYERIIEDLQQAIYFLPQTQVSPMLPTKPAAYAMLARVYLSMRNYEEAGRYADSAYRYGLPLLDYNTLNPDLARPFELLNKEVIFHAQTVAPTLLSVSRAKVDSILYDSFLDDDLRKSLFFQPNGDGTHGFKGNYTGGTGLFVGIASDEVYLMKAECEARSGNVAAAMEVLNQLLVTRWRKGTFIPLAAGTPQEALTIVLQERRKSLIYRTLRWMDIKRLNKEGYRIELVRQLGHTRYVLPPNNPRYALAIPEDIVNVSGIPQNPR